LNREERNHVEKLINKYSDLFQISDNKLCCTNAVQHRIIIDNQLIHTKQYRYPPIHKEEIDRQVKIILENNEIVSSPYNSSLWVIPKKPDSLGNKRWRMVIDFRALNKKTVGVSTLKHYRNIGSAPNISAFSIWPQIFTKYRCMSQTQLSLRHGHYQFKRMPFGLKNGRRRFRDSWIRFYQGFCRESNYPT